MREAVTRQLARAKLTTWMVVAFVVVACASVLFVKLASAAPHGDTLGFDRSVLLFLDGHSARLLDTIIPILTDVGGVVCVGALTAILTALFVYKREYWRATLIAVGVAGAGLLNIILKTAFVRERPDRWVQLVHETGYSFPSGHAMMSSAFALAIAIALWRSRWRWWGVVFAITFVLFVGFSRLYLGVHYPTDILAGWLVSVVWVTTVAFVLHLDRFQRVFRAKDLSENT